MRGYSLTYNTLRTMLTRLQVKQMSICYNIAQLTQWSRVLLEKLTGFQLVKNFPAFYGTQRFITTVTRVCHLSLS